MTIENPIRIGFLVLIALAFWLYNIGLFAKGDEQPKETLQATSTSWNLDLQGKLSLLAKQNPPPLEKFEINPFFPSLKAAQPEPITKEPTPPPPPPMPEFPGSYVGYVEGPEKATFMLQWNGQLTFLKLGESLGSWELKSVTDENLIFVSGEFIQEVTR